MKLVYQVFTENRYAGSDWNLEKTTKYVFQHDEAAYEVGYFEHYKDHILKKVVIELPTSFGCPARCKFCASSAIQTFRQLDETQMMKLFHYVYEKRNLLKKQYVLVTITGTGDLYYNFENLIRFLKQLASFHNVFVTLSSCLWNQQLLKEIEKLSDVVPIRYIQISFLSVQPAIAHDLIPVYPRESTSFLEILNYIEKSNRHYYRINYIFIRDINDSLSDFIRFRNLVAHVKDKVIIRISKLNETQATQRHFLYPANVDEMKQLQQILYEAGIQSYLFYAYKNDHLNCGQLLTEN